MPQREPVKILLVDDGEKNLLALQALLQEDGLELVKARSGPEALEMMLIHDFGLALLDVQMPTMDGFELAQLMRGTERTRRIPIIFLTAVATDDRRRFRGYETGAVDYLLKPFDPQMLRNKVAVFVELDRQRSDLARQRDELRASAERLSTALNRLQAHGDNSPLAVVEFGPSLHIIGWSKGAERLFGWAAEEIVGQLANDLLWLSKEILQDFSALLAETLTGTPHRMVKLAQARRVDGTEVACELYLSVLRDPAGRPVSLNALILDVTERIRADETRKLLIGELNHRVKNTLATVQAIATLTLRHNRTPEDFASNFAGRIQALARAHSLLSDAVWKGASLTDLISDQLRVGAVDEQRLQVSGPSIVLPPQMALHLALILHELATNANKYGALSGPTGTISLNWTVIEEQLKIQWIESGVERVKAPSKRGFGTTLIEQGVKAEGGMARAEYRSDGITWDISLPLPRINVSETSLEPKSFVEMADADSESKDVRGLMAGRRLLVIEDEPLVAMEIENILRDAGASVTVCGSTSSALHNIEQLKFDAALLDGNLHGTPADEIAAALTRFKIPFAFVSGYGKQSLPRAFAGATVVTKPFLPSELLETAVKLSPARAAVLRLAR